jgi:hypothetical protein
MIVFFGWVLLISAAVLFVNAFRRPEGVPAAAAPRGPNKTYLWSGLGALLLGLALVVLPGIAEAHTRPVDLSRKDKWAMNQPPAPDTPIHWDGNALVADLESGSGRYAVFPVDWDANRFQAEWDIILTRLDLPGDPVQLKDGGKTRTQPRSKLDFASVGLGLMDQNAANIDDRDHVSGSSIEACFSNDIRLRASDANFLVRTSSSDESGKEKLDPDFKKTDPVRIELNKRYHCALSYESGSADATLRVRDESGKEVVSRRLEDLKDFTNSVAYFGISVRGYNRFDKALDAKKAENGYTRPKAVARIENLTYRQP